MITRSLIVVIVLFANFILSVPIKKEDDEDPCRTCQMLMNIALHHFTTTPTKEQLKSELLEECQDISRHEGPSAGKNCMNLINNNMDLIYQDLEVKHKSPEETCQDLKQCF